MSHSGTEIIKAIKASKVETNDHSRLSMSEPPRLRSSCGKRRLATNVVKAGVINSATVSKDKITMTGVTTKITSKGASTSFRLPAPILCSHAHTVLTTDELSSAPRTHSSVLSQ